MSFEKPSMEEIIEKGEGSEATDMGGDSHKGEEESGEIDPKYTERKIRQTEEEGGDITLKPNGERAA